MRITYWTLLLEGLQILHPLSADLILFKFNHSKILSCSMSASNLTARLICLPCMPCSSGTQVISSIHQNMRSSGIRCHMSVGHSQCRPLFTLFAPPWRSHPLESPSMCDLLLIIPAQSYFWHLYIWVLMTFLYRYLPCTDHFWGAILLKKWCTYL